MPEPFNRRAFLARAGILGAVVGTGGVLAALPVWAGNSSSPGPAPLNGNTALTELVNVLRPALDFLARDSMAGLAAFALPGNDQYSVAQGTPSTTAGAIAARGAEFMAQALDDFIPFPSELARPLAAAFSTALADLHLPLPNPVSTLSGQLVTSVDQALSVLLNNDQTIPLSLAVAILLNMLATQVNPSTTVVPGPDLSPFSRLTFAQKAQAFALLEGTESNLVEALDMQLPEPLHGSVSGLMKFVGGSLLEFAAFGSVNEWGVFDPKTRQLTARPVGWQLSGYQPNGVVDGWDEFKGYYQGRQMVTDV
ncbi:MAG TPA: hypothetical protein VHT30_04865 [Acidimicrobiales bacterium]|jgi:hypothetical protein|nr:hypothetical protein [Acidimicrobiales bacterium]